MLAMHLHDRVKRALVDCCACLFVPAPAPWHAPSPRLHTPSHPDLLPFSALSCLLAVPRFFDFRAKGSVRGQRPLRLPLPSTPPCLVVMNLKYGRRKHPSPSRALALHVKELKQRVRRELSTERELLHLTSQWPFLPLVHERQSSPMYSPGPPPCPPPPTCPCPECAESEAARAGGVHAPQHGA